MKLFELQEALQDYILTQENPGDFHFINSKGQHFEERLAIYREGYYLRLIGALKSDYEVLQSYLGVGTFNQLMVNYVEACPSRYFSIRDVGMHLSEYIRTQLPEQLLWSELAEFEWKLTEILFNKEVEVLSLEDLKSIAPEQWPELVFKLHPSAYLMKHHYNIPESWPLLKENKSCDFIHHPEANFTLIWRKGYQSYFLSLGAHEETMFTTLQKQLCFSDFCEAMCDYIPEESAVTWVSQVLQRWMAEGLICI